MLRYLAHRIAGTIFVILGITVLTFVISHIVPADPALAAAGQNATKDQIAAIREQLELDRPLPIQYWDYLKGLSQGDLGRSIQTHRPISDDIKTFFPATLELTLFTMILYTLIGVPLGVLAAMRRGWIDRLTSAFTVAGVAIPPFWLSLVLQLLLFATWNVLPYGARLDKDLAAPEPITHLYTVDSLLRGEWNIFGNSLLHLILPATTLALGRMAVIVRVTKRSIRDNAVLDYVRTARAKGLDENVVLRRHIIRNSLIPIVTMIGLQTGWLLNGAIVIEVIFSWPGMGQYAVNAINYSDFPAVMGVTLVVALLFVAINFFVDLSYRLIDPRVSSG
jgi:peptide/nickel transport system permease protein